MHAYNNHLTLEAGDRPEVPNVVLVLTDGHNNDYGKDNSRNIRVLVEGNEKLTNREADVSFQPIILHPANSMNMSL